MSASSAGARPLAGKGVAAPSVYQRALDSFHRQEFAKALRLLEEAKGSDAKASADILNLRGAIYLRQSRFDKAREMFTQAIALDPGLWAAQFNLAEIAFRQKRYEESARQFDALLGRTSRARQPEEWAFVRYKMLLSSLAAGDESRVTRELEDLGRESKPSLTYYYLKAAIEHRAGRKAGAEKWLAQASAAHAPDAERAFAESFQQMGWSSRRSERLAATLEETRPRVMPVLGPSASPLAVALVKEPPLPPGFEPVTANSRRAPATLAVVQLMHEPQVRQAAPAKIKIKAADPKPPAAVEADRPGFRMGVAAATPPPVNPPAASQEEEAAPEVGVPSSVDTPEVMARKRTQPASDDSSPGASSKKAASAPAASAAASLSAAPSASPSPTPSTEPANPVFLQKYEAAYVKFLEKDYPGAKALLDEADAIQSRQPASIELRNKIFLHYQQGAYSKYLEKDYAGAQTMLDLADGVQTNQPDALNLRGLIYSRQRNFEQAEAMFKKAIDMDPAFWAAKFNMAELPFTYKNYTAARSRYEKLYAETDAAKQPREAELTQFKIFLTLLLEGKEAAARAFMEHFKFTGATPARYYCQASLEFYGGNSEKAQTWIASAKREYPAQIEAIFADSFYRVGWLTDPVTKSTASAAIASATPSPGASASPGVSPVASPAASVAVAASTPKPPMTSASASPAASPAVVASAATPAKGPTPDRLFVQPSPVPAEVALAAPGVSPRVPASPTAALAVASPAASPKATTAGSASSSPAAAGSPVVVAAASPGPSAAMEEASPESVAEVAPSPQPEDASALDNQQVLRWLIVLMFVLYFVGSWVMALRKATEIRARAKKPALRYSGRKTPSKEVEAPR